jgi:ribonuclease R
VVAALSASEQGPLKSKELARMLDVGPAEYRTFRRLLARLERAGTIYKVKGRRFAVAASLDLVAGRISVTRDGHGFVRPDEPGEDVYVPAHRLTTAMDGDHVVARVERRPRGRSREGSVIRVLERARDSVVGTLHLGRKLSYVVPLDARLRRDVLITAGGEGDAEEGMVVVVRLTSYGEGRVGPTGEVERVLGELSDPGVDVLAVAHGYGLSLDFPSEVLADAERAAEVGSADPGLDRIDRTDLDTFTIDPADAKDHDDALSVVELEDGVIEVGVHIADVSHYVRPGSAVDVEAAARATSVYLVDRTIPMLPSVLSNEACSLNPERERLAVSVFVRLDREGSVLDRRYERTVIRCRRGLSYEEAQEVLDGEARISEAVDQALRLLDDRARQLRRRRRERGALDFDLPEAKVILDDEGLPVDIRRRDRLESHRLIEDYMILANEVVAADLESRDLATMYRIHEPPVPEKVEALTETLSHYGLQIVRRKALRPSALQRVLDSAKGLTEEALVSNLVLRSMTKARYHTENLGHFGLASEGYLHFTSPIRRYPDLVAHRVVTEVLVHNAPEPYADREALGREAEICSGREQAAAEAERASVAMKKVEFMERHLGELFDGRISGVAAFGLFVQLEDFFVDGLVHVSGLHDDYYHFHEREHRLVGERGGRSFRLGERVEVQVARVDKEARHVDFALIRKRPG